MREWLSDEGWPYPDAEQANDDVVVDLTTLEHEATTDKAESAYVFMAQQIVEPLNDDDDNGVVATSRFGLGS